MYCFAPGYLVPLLNNAVFRLIAIVSFAIFVLASLILLFLPKNHSIWNTIFLLVYVFVVLIPNIMIPALGPAIATVFPFKYYETVLREGIH